MSGCSLLTCGEGWTLPAPCSRSSFCLKWAVDFPWCKATSDFWELLLLPQTPNLSFPSSEMAPTSQPHRSLLRCSAAWGPHCSPHTHPPRCLTELQWEGDQQRPKSPPTPGPQPCSLFQGPTPCLGTVDSHLPAPTCLCSPQASGRWCPPPQLAPRAPLWQRHEAETLPDTLQKMKTSQAPNPSSGSSPRPAADPETTPGPRAPTTQVQGSKEPRAQPQPCQGQGDPMTPTTHITAAPPPLPAQPDFLPDQDCCSPRRPPKKIFGVFD